MVRWQNRIDPGANPEVVASSNKGQLDLERMRAKFKKFFRVPDIPMASFMGTYYRGGRQFVVGEIGVSENFICFKSKFGVSGTKISVRTHNRFARHSDRPLSVCGCFQRCQAVGEERAFIWIRSKFDSNRDCLGGGAFDRLIRSSRLK